MVGAVHLRMAIQATLAQQELRWRTRRQPVRCLRNTGMAGRRVATLAQQRCAAAQHAGMVGTVRRVAQSAVLANRSMFPKIGAALFRVALVAGIVGSLANQLQFSRCSVRAVTIGTIHFPFG